MGHVIGFLSKIDAFIQNHFDSACFFLMRRFGVRKSGIRYALYALSIVSMLASLLADAALGVAMTTSRLFEAFLIPVMAGSLVLDLHSDRKAETSPGTASYADAGSRIYKVLGYLNAATTATEFLSPPRRYALLTDGAADGRSFPIGAALLFWIAWVLLGYLGKTPMNPPPEEARSPAHDLQPAPSKS